MRPPARVQLQREDPARARARQLDRARQQNYGFERVERLEGNVGYLDLRYFDGTPHARPTAVAAMAFVLALWGDGAPVYYPRIALEAGPMTLVVQIVLVALMAVPALGGRRGGGGSV